MTPERIVLFLSPIFVGVSGWIVQLVARYFPGAPRLDKTELAAAAGIGATAAIVFIFKWADERGKQNARKATLVEGT